MQLKTLNPPFSSRCLYGIPVLVWVLGCYLFPNKILLRPATEVVKTVIDSWVPLSPPWVWIYVSYYGFLTFSFFMVRKEFRRLVTGYIVSAGASGVVFFTFPTIILREYYPLVDDGSLSVALLNLIRITDESTNCAPSMHAAMTTMAACSLWFDKSRWKWFGALWALLIAYSTMATKQHYFIDVITGFLFGGSVFLLLHPRLPVIRKLNFFKS